MPVALALSSHVGMNGSSSHDLAGAFFSSWQPLLLTLA